ncbi:ATP-dependent Clp protease proteolytic subunit 1, partial [Dysosmobacter welbionis]
KAAAPLKAIGVTVSEESIRAYLEDLNHRGRREETVRFYAAKLKTFYDYLPPDKQIVLNTLETWRQALLAEGYAPATVNTNISAANGLLDYLGRRDLQLTGQLETETAPQSELTRTEYLRLLSAARALEKERTYLLVKAIALTGAHVGELPQITVEAVQSGRTPAVSGGEQRRVQLPRCLQAELLSYCRRQGLTAGPVFVTRSRRPLRRTQVTGDIQSLSGAARVAPEKCNPRCLRKLYLVT